MCSRSVLRNMNSVGALLQSPFSTLTYENKLHIKELLLGRPTRHLNIIQKQQSAKVNRSRKFNPDICLKNH